jgi:hypothetical protein
MPVNEIWRKYVISSADSYNWMASTLQAGNAKGELG